MTRSVTTHYDEPEVFVAALYEKIMITQAKSGQRGRDPRVWNRRPYGEHQQGHH
ncbi:MAG: hypothetical protein MZV63_37595 [Marinilabiliales bacterium]|nr:hypothetical protein [Marinilabiliales bacterium]